MASVRRHFVSRPGANQPTGSTRRRLDCCYCSRPAAVKQSEAKRTGMKHSEARQCGVKPSEVKQLGAKQSGTGRLSFESFPPVRAMSRLSRMCVRQPNDRLALPEMASSSLQVWDLTLPALQVLVISPKYPASFSE